VLGAPGFRDALKAARNAGPLDRDEYLARLSLHGLALRSQRPDEHALLDALASTLDATEVPS
jgi:hypothetical protein